MLAVGGCSQPLIMFRPTLAQAPAETDTTGSIAPAAPRSFGGDLSIEDWRRAKAALGVALDPQGNGQPVKWDNPGSGMRGMVNPTGLPFVRNDEICRGFLATVIGPSGNRFVRGTGCRPSGGAWELKSLKATTKPAGDPA
ncbi:RT0821/Lpp0805 family surface protein [Methylobacterium crusticola]|nr:RT0821/Lpp0805 family surface protein [Methylobacterium crusticola]